MKHSYNSHKSQNFQYNQYNQIAYNKNDYDEIDPFSVLNISPVSSFDEIRAAYMKLATCPLRIVRARACLAYDILCNKEKYYKIGNKYKVKVKDCFYYTIIGDLKTLKFLIENNKNLLYQKDKLQRNLLYIAARNGYFNITEYLLNKGININEVQSTGSTALHGAAFYGQELVIQLLIEHGIDTKIKNNFGSTAADEAKLPSIRQLILISDKDQITQLYNNLYSKGLVSNRFPIKIKNRIIALKLLCSSGLSKEDYIYIKNNWVPAWHGTKFRFLESIIRYGLVPSGSKLSNGKTINVNPGHIPLNYCVSGIQFWAKAVFVSPSIFYAANPIYSERINSCKQRWCVLVETRIRPGCYTKHPSSVLNYTGVSGEPSNVEYRVSVHNNSDLIYRISSAKNIVVTSVTFVLTSFLENINNYYAGNIVIYSKEERMLFGN